MALLILGTQQPQLLGFVLDPVWLDAEPVVCGRVVLLLPGDEREDSAVLQVSQQLQVTRFTRANPGSQFLGVSSWDTAHT